MKLFHGTRAKFVAHIGLCLTDSRSAAIEYSRTASGAIGHVTAVDLALAGLRVVEVEGFGEGETADACGDTEGELAALSAEGVDVVRYDDQAVGMDETHRTWRIVSDKALAACRVL